jgi:hypothetical protein
MPAARARLFTSEAGVAGLLSALVDSDEADAVAPFAASTSVPDRRGSAHLLPARHARASEFHPRRVGMEPSAFSHG